jgi:haloacetate dehalogenase
MPLFVSLSIEPSLKPATSEDRAVSEAGRAGLAHSLGTGAVSEDLLPGFSVRSLRARDTEIFARIGGQGPPLLLLHGYPETHVCWHRVANQLARHYTVIVCDLPGYGRSAPLRESGRQTQSFSKREMGRDLIAAMGALGFSAFSIVGHDRGGRVAYRMALDHPAAVTSLTLVSILPTFEMWSRLESNDYAMKAFRWFLLAQPSPLPEVLIERAGLAYLHVTLRDWTKEKNLSVFEPRALAAYEAAYTGASTIAASCADYRAGWTVDRFHDKADLEVGRTVVCPTLVLWGTAEFPDEVSVLTAWRRLAPLATGRGIACGHFVPEEAPGECLAALFEFLPP